MIWFHFCVNADDFGSLQCAMAPYTMHSHPFGFSQLSINY